MQADQVVEEALADHEDDVSKSYGTQSTGVGWVGQKQRRANTK